MGPRPSHRDALLGLLSMERFEGLVWDPTRDITGFPQVLRAWGLPVCTASRSLLHCEGAPVPNIIGQPPSFDRLLWVNKMVHCATHKIALLMPPRYLQFHRADFESTGLTRVHLRDLHPAQMGQDFNPDTYAWFVWDLQRPSETGTFQGRWITKQDIADAVACLDHREFF